MKKIILVLVLVLLLNGCCKSELCLEELGKKICQERGMVFYNMAQGIYVTYGVWCLDKNREVKEYYFTFEERRECK